MQQNSPILPKALTTAEASTLIADAIGRPVHPSTVRRWCSVGLRTLDGSRVKLPCLVVGGRRLILTAQISAFLDATVWTEDDGGDASDAS